MTRFESLPNELFYHLFSYLSAEDILRGLADLNWRFANLSANYNEYKVDFRHVKKHIYDDLTSKLIPAQIQSLHLSNKRETFGQIPDFFDRFSLSSFSLRLRSLSLKSCSEEIWKRIVPELPLLKNLVTFSFVANAGTAFDVQSRRSLVRAIAQLPVLQRCIVKIYNDELIFNDTEEFQFRSLEYLCLGLSSIDQIVYVCRRAPKLKRLTIDAIFVSSLDIDDCSSLANLTHFSLRTAATIDELERLLFNARSLLSLSLVVSDDTCRDAIRWQRVLSRMKLSVFRFIYVADPTAAMNAILEPFCDKFWLERHCHICYEQQQIDGRVDLYTIPYFLSSFLLERIHPFAFFANTRVNTCHAFEHVRELIYTGTESETSPHDPYHIFPHVETLVLETGIFPPLNMVPLDHLRELRIHTSLNDDLVRGLTMPILTKLILHAMPVTWTMPIFEQKVQYLKLRLSDRLTDEQVEEMCAPTSFALSCRQLSLPVRSKRSISLILNRFIHLESVSFMDYETELDDDAGMTVEWIRGETHLRNFLLASSPTNKRVTLWIGR